MMLGKINISSKQHPWIQVCNLYHIIGQHSTLPPYAHLKRNYVIKWNGQDWPEMVLLT